MDVGVTIPHTGRHASPEWVREYCTTAEQLGFDSLWAFDTIGRGFILPDPLTALPVAAFSNSPRNTMSRCTDALRARKRTRPSELRLSKTVQRITRSASRHE